jgi:hypothetical protein
VLIVMAFMAMFLTPQLAGRGITERAGACATRRFVALSDRRSAGSRTGPRRFKNVPHTTAGNKFGGQAHA